jgi:ribosome-associated protein
MTLPEDELRFTFSRSGGPGGQNVNRRETRVQLTFDVAASRALTDEQKRIVLAHVALRHLIVGAGVVQVTAETHRTQRGNMDAAVERLHALIAAALKPRRSRVRTKPTRGSKERRLQEKKRRSETKSRRRGHE